MSVGGDPDGGFLTDGVEVYVIVERQLERDGVGGDEIVYVVGEPDFAKGSFAELADKLIWPDAVIGFRHNRMRCDG